MASQETYNSESNYKLIKLTLTKDVEIIDLKSIFFDITIYESMTDQGISGAISIIDAHNINLRTPLYGNEIINIEFKTSGSDNIIKVSGIVYQVDTGNRTSATSSGYVIRFMDEFLYRNTRTKYRYGHESEYSKMVSAIYSNVMKNSRTDKKTIDVVDTVGIDVWCGNKTTPLFVINKISERSYSKSNEYGYIFWQDNIKFNFKPLEYLFKQDPVTKFLNTENGIYKDVTQRNVERFTAIKNISFPQDNNSHIKNLLSGTHGSKWYSVDLITKDINEFEYTKNKYFDKTKSLGNSAHLYNDIDEDDFDDVHIMEVQANVSDGLKHKSLNLMQKNNIDSFYVDILCSGDSSLKTGDIAEIEIPNWNNSANTDSTTIYNGKVLISQIKHILNKRTYMQQIRLNKDAFESEILQ